MGTAPWMWLVMGGGTVAFWVAVVYIARLAFSDRRTGTAQPRQTRDACPPSTRRGTSAPLEVLQGRLARGEIDVDEYARTRKALVDSDPAIDADRAVDARP